MRFSATGKIRLKLLVLLIIVIIALGWIFIPRGDSLGAEIRRIVLISIDTCRADHLSCYGYSRPTTPNIDRMASESVVFLNALSPVPMTLPSHSSMLTGTIPPYHGVHDNYEYFLNDKHLTLAEILKNVGFVTGAFVSSTIIDSKLGLSQGFDTYNDQFEKPHGYLDDKERFAQETTSVALKWLEQRKDEKFFMFLHYYDPHLEYIPPEPFATEFADNLYAGEIAYVDHCIGQVIETLKKKGLYDSTLIVITGDHGEMLGDHGEVEHAFFIYQSAIKVPLIFKLPQQTQHNKVNSLVGIIDIVPTICEMLGIKTPKHVGGKDLSGYFEKGGVGSQKKILYCESLTPTKYGANSLLGIVTDRWKYIQTTRPELYDLIEDPGETNNLADLHPQQARILQDKLRQILDSSVGVDSSQSKYEADEQRSRTLESLGYVARAVDEEFSFDQSKADPKDVVGRYVSTVTLDRLIANKKWTKSQALCQKLLEQYPDWDLEFKIRLAEINMKTENYVAAVDILNEMLKFKPDNYDIHVDLGMSLAGLGKYEEAVKHLKKAILINPQNDTAYHNLAVITYEQGKFDQAIIYCEKVLTLDPQSVKILNVLAKTKLQQGKFDSAIKTFDKAVSIYSENRINLYMQFGELLAQKGLLEMSLAHFDNAISEFPDMPGPYAYKAGILLKLDRKDQAVQHLENMARRWPNEPQTYFDLGNLFFQMNKLDQAVESYQRLLEINPNHESAYNLLASVHLTKKDYDNAIDSFTRSLQLKPDQPKVLGELAQIHFELGKTVPAVEYWTQALQFQPDWPAVLNNLAWIKTTSKDPSIRNPQQAIQLAQRACELTKNEEPVVLDTLAMAYAADGRIEEAIETSQKALNLAEAVGNKGLAARIKEHLDSYQDNSQQ